MTTLIEKPLAKPVILYSVTPETIAEMATRYAGLKINGIDDKAGYEVVQKARMDCVKARSAVEKQRKELKADALEFGRKVDAEAKLLTTKIEAIEQPLLAQQESVEAAKEAVRKEREDKVYAERQAAWDAVDGPKTDRAYLLSHTDDQFAARLQQQFVAKQARIEAQAKAEAECIERERIAAEQAEKNRIEAERLAAERAEMQRIAAEQEAERKRMQAIEDAKLAKERAELDRLRKEQAEAQAKIDAEQNRLAKIEQERMEAERLEKAKAEAAERARIETETRLKREAEEAERKRLADEEAAKRAEALKPVRQKLEDFAAKVKLLPLPSVDEGLQGSVQHVLDVASNDILKIAKGLK